MVDPVAPEAVLQALEKALRKKFRGQAIVNTINDDSEALTARGPAGTIRA